MFDIKNKLHFIGIGGSAMGNAATACAKAGYKVSGSDNNVYSPMRDMLDASEIEYYNGYSKLNIQNKTDAIIVVGNAISRKNEELEFALDNRLQLISMPELVGSKLIGRKTSVVIAGTHGKTTTASLTAWLLESLGASPGFFIGGLPENFNSGCRAASGDIFVSEGDEYDSAFFDKRSKFLHYRPNAAVINNIEFDHADIFSSIDDILKSFKQFVNIIPRNGVLLINKSSDNCRLVASGALCKVDTFGIEPDAVWRAAEIDYSPEGASFTLIKSNIEIGRIKTALFGEMNIRNAIAAIAVAISALELDAAFHKKEMQSQSYIQLLQNGFNTFKLPKRRLEIIGEWRGATVVDDFAHHPTAISETIAAAKQKFPTRRLIACFEPRSNTSARSFFQKQLSECFDGVSAVIVCPLNRPERYLVEERLNVQKLTNDIRRRGINASYIEKSEDNRDNWGEDVANRLGEIAQSNDVILLFSNGDLGGFRKYARKI